MKICMVLIVLLSLKQNIYAEESAGATVSGTINEFKVDNIADGVYSFRFKTPENLERQESGYLDGEDNFIVDGFYSYIDPDGKQQYVSYHADKNGYRTYPYQVMTVISYRLDANLVASFLG